MGAKAYMNHTTANLLLENQNDADLKGFQNTNFVNLPYSVEEMNKILMMRGIPEIMVYDEGYYDEDGNYQLFLTDAEVIVIGKRPGGQMVGDWCATPTLHKSKNGMPAPGYFSIIEVNGNPSAGAMTISLADLGAGKNPKIETTGGIYGGTRLIYPRSIVKMTVAT